MAKLSSLNLLSHVLTNLSPYSQHIESCKLVGWFLDDVSIGSKWIKNRRMASKFFQYLVRFSSADI